MLGGGAAVAGLGGLAAAALTAGGVHDSTPTTQTPSVETRTVVVRTVEHRVRRIRPKHHNARVTAAQPVRVTPAAVAAPAPVQVVAAPAPVAPAPTPTTPLRTRASGGGSRSGDDAGEHDSSQSHDNEGGESRDD